MARQNVAKHAVELGFGPEAGFGHRDQVIEKRVELYGEAARLGRAPGSQAGQKMRPIPAINKRCGNFAAPVVNGVASQDMRDGGHGKPKV